MSARVSSTASASAEIGTQTSVTIAVQPGRDARIARYASCRIFHSRLRSSCARAH